MCNLYKMTSTVNEMKALFGEFSGDRSNLQTYDGIYPDREAPIIVSDESLTLKSATWGIPAWKPGMRPITSVRNLTSSFWRNMLAKRGNRCLVPVTSFCEWTGKKGNKRKVWFGLKEEQLFAFAGIWRSTDEGPRMAFLTCEPNSIVAPIHPKAMPVILRPEDYGCWLAGDDAESLAVPFASGSMEIDSELTV